MRPHLRTPAEPIFTPCEDMQLIHFVQTSQCITDPLSHHRQYPTHRPCPTILPLAPLPPCPIRTPLQGIRRLWYNPAYPPPYRVEHPFTTVDKALRTLSVWTPHHLYDSLPPNHVRPPSAVLLPPIPANQTPMLANQTPMLATITI